MNKVILIGRLTVDPEIRYTTGNEPMAVASYTLAVQREYKNHDGNYDSDFIRCKAFGKKAEFCERYLHKGMKIAAEGSLQTGNYEKDGVKHYTTDLIVQKHEFCESRNTSQEGGQNVPQNAEAPEGFAMIDDELPF